MSTIFAVLETRNADSLQEFLVTNRSCDVNAYDALGLTPLDRAVLSNDVDSLDVLLNHPDILVNLGNKLFNATPFLIACQEGHLEIFHRLYSDPRVNVTKADHQGCTPFFLACQNGHLEIVRQLLLDPRIDVNIETAEGCTPFFGSCSHGRVEVVTRLLQDARVDINKGDIDGRTPLYISCSHAEIQVVKALLKNRRIDVNKEEEVVGFTPLIIACGGGDLELVQLLVRDHRTDVHKPMKRGLTPLDYSAQNGNIEIIKWLLARFDHTSDEAKRSHRTAMRIAQDFRFHEAVNLLKMFKTDPVRTQMALREELKFEAKPADIFAMVVLLCDDYLQLREVRSHEESLKGIKTALRFFEFAQRLPFDLQMVLCCRAAGSPQDVITSGEFEPCLRELTRAFVSLAKESAEVQG